jgi:hypothetical protein
MPAKRALILTLIAAALLCFAATESRGTLSAEIESGLKSSKFVYISSTRKDGGLSKPAEIWFMYHGGSVYVGTSPKSWRARRINWGRPAAKIWVGKPDGPSFTATGAIVKDENAEQTLLKTFAEKYPEGWGRWEKSFREGFKDGKRVLIKYTPNE